MTSRGWAAFAALGIIWGLPYFFIKLSVQELSPVVVAFGRVALGTLILLPIAWRRGALRSLGGHTTAICAFALAEFVIPFLVISFGERWISSSVTGILIATVPLSIALIQRFFGVHERLGLWRILGLAMGFVGVAALELLLEIEAEGLKLGYRVAGEGGCAIHERAVDDLTVDGLTPLCRDAGCETTADVIVEDVLPTE